MYAGDEFIVYFKYSGIYNVVFVCCFFGVGLPILFPICLLNMVILYVLERYCMAYIYDIPPALDDGLTTNTH